jgi:hypothetical protein
LIHPLDRELIGVHRHDVRRMFRGQTRERAGIAAEIPDDVSASVPHGITDERDLCIEVGGFVAVGGCVVGPGGRCAVPAETADKLPEPSSICDDERGRKARPAQVALDVSLRPGRAAIERGLHDDVGENARLSKIS